MKTQIKILTTTLMLSLFFSSCNQNPLQSALSSTGNSQTGQGTDQGGTNPPVAAIDKVDLNSRVEDPSNQVAQNGKLAFTFDKVRGEFVIMLPLPPGFIFTPQGSFQKYPDITFGPIFDTTGMRLAVRVPVKYVLKGVQFLPPAKLPSGEALPQMPAGQKELPSLALSFPQQNNTQIYLYIGVNALGLFVTLPQSTNIPLPMNITVPLKNADKTRTFGFLTYVSAKNGYPAGLFLATGVPNDIARILEDYFGL